MYVVWHDNGVPGQMGYTEHSASDIEAMGGLDALAESYAKNGITIYEINRAGI